MRLGSFMSRFTFMDNGFDAIKACFPQHDYIMDPEAAQEALPTLDGILVDRIDRSLLDQAVSLKALFTSFTGINHLPIDLLRERGVKVINIHCQAPEVAQCALAMALAFYGRVVEYHNALRATRWHGFWAGHATDDRWTSLFRRPCAIFGTGAIGTALARLLKAFECPVTGYRRHADAQIPPHFDRIETDLAKAVEESVVPPPVGSAKAQHAFYESDSSLAAHAQTHLPPEHGLGQEPQADASCPTNWQVIPTGNVDGRANQKVLPFPGSLSTPIFPK